MPRGDGRIRDHFADYHCVGQGGAVKISGEDLGDVLGAGLAVVHPPVVRGLQLEHRLVGAHAHTADRVDHSLLAAMGKLGLDRGHRLLGAGCQPAGAHADRDIQLCANLPLPEIFGRRPSYRHALCYLAHAFSSGRSAAGLWLGYRSAAHG